MCDLSKVSKETLHEWYQSALAESMRLRSELNEKNAKITQMYRQSLEDKREIKYYQELYQTLSKNQR